MPLYAALLAAAPAKAEKTNNFLIPNGTFIFEWIVFVLVLVFIARKILPRITAMIEKRQETIKQQFDDAKKAKDDAEKARKEYVDALAETRKEISRLREEANDEKQQIIEEARSEARRQAEELLEQNRTRLETERQQILLSLRSEIGELAFALSEKIVRDSLRDEERQRKLVDDFIAGVGTTVKVEADARS
ncbi:MAG: F0F1 ATP synthase subunit B [Frankiales bacterium]|nr:F0F1 ATP synthase subunit B [Frankiales bacterium]